MYLCICNAIADHRIVRTAEDSARSDGPRRHFQHSQTGKEA